MKRKCNIVKYFLFGILLLMMTSCNSLMDMLNQNDITDNQNDEISDALSKLTLSDLEVTYDGNAHSIYVEGDIPEGITVEYENNAQINAGSYNVKATFIDTAGYNIPLPVLEAQLIINKAQLTVTLSERTFSYDGNAHSIHINEELPDGVVVNYTNNNQVSEGTYNVSASIVDETGNYDVPSELSTTMTIEKDGKFHDLIIIYADGTKEEKVVENGYLIEELPLSNVVGYTSYYIDDDTLEEINFPFSVNQDITIKNVENPNEYTVDYYYNDELIFSDTVKYDSNYIFKEMYVNEEGKLLIELKNGEEIIEPGSTVQYNYLENMSIQMVFQDKTTNFEYTVTENMATITKCKSTTQQTVEIPKYIFDGQNYYKVISIGDSAFKSYTNLTTVIIPEGVVHIEASAFANCGRLINITLPSTLKTIGNSVFLSCVLLTNVTIPEGVESIGNSAFEKCIRFDSVTLPSTIQSMGDRVFAECSSLVNVTISEGVADIGNYTFTKCGMLKTITIPSTVSHLGNYVFYECSSFASIVLSEGVESIGMMTFLNCRKFKNITLPSTLRSIDNPAFNYLENVYYTGTFDTWCELEYLAVSNSNPMTYATNFYLLDEENNWYKPTEIVLSDAVTKINDGLFSGFEQITKVVLPSSITSIGRSVFSSCTGLVSIELPFIGENSDGTGATYFGHIFGADRTSYNGLYIPKSVKNITITNCSKIDQYAFGFCENIENIVILGNPDTIGEYAFYSCSSLVSLKLPNTIISIENNAFSACSSLIDFEIPSSVTEIGENSVFSGCSSLESVVIPQGVTILGNGIFASCSNLKSVTISEGVTKLLTSAFANCTSLTNVTLPSTVEYLGMSAFNGCTNLKSIQLSESLTYIGLYCFSGCSSLESIVIPLSVTQIEGSGFVSTPLLTIYCEVDSQPKNWKYQWNKDGRPVYYSAEWEYDSNGNPVPLN